MFYAVYGKAGAGKTEYIFRRAEENIKNKIRTFILVPEQFSMQTERGVISRLGTGAQTYVEVLTFSRLCNMVMSIAGPMRMKYIDGAGKYIVAQRTMQRLEKKLSVFASNVHQRGFAKIAVNAISEFKRYGVTPEALRAAAESDSAAEMGFADKLRELALIFEEYSLAINEKSADAEDNLVLILERIQKCDFLRGNLYISGFKSFTPLELRAVGALMNMCEVCVSLTTDDLHSTEPHFSTASGTYRRLCEVAHTEGAEIGEPVFMNAEDKFENSPALRHLRDEFFRVPPREYRGEADGGILLYTPQDYYDEVRTAAKLILKLCREEGYRFGDIMLLTRSAENYDRIIPSVFGQHGINVFLDSKRGILQNPLMRNINAVLDILIYGFSYERVMTALRSGFYDVTPDEADIFENYILIADPSHAMWSKAGEWEYNPNEKIYDMELINRVAAAVAKPVAELRGAFSGRKTCAKICGALFDWLEKSRACEIMADRIKRFADSGRHDAAAEYRQVWNSTITLISQLSDIMGDDYITFEGFAELLGAAAKECRVGIVPPSLDSVTVGEIDRFRRNNAKAVIVLGVTDGVFPKKYIGEGLISDSEREVLSPLGVELAPTANMRRAEEQSLIYSVLTASCEKLILSAPVSDGKGNYLRPSPVFETVKKIFKIEPCPLSEEDGFEGGEAVLDLLAARAAAGVSDDEPVTRAALEYFSENERFKNKFDEIENMLERVGRRELLSEDEVRLLYGETARLSVSKLEKYNSCAFAYFLQYGLIVRERDRAGFEPSNMGTVIHAALEGYLRGLKESGADYGEISRDECFGAVAELVEKAASGDEFCETSSYYRYLVMRMKRIAGATAWEIVRFYSRSAFRPLGFEMSIGEGGDLPPRVIETDNGRAVLEGFIDRADAAEIDGERYMAVTDYKLSGKSLDLELAARGLRFQPLIYTDILREQGYSPAAMLYMATSDPITKFASEPTDEELELAVRENMRAQGWVLSDEAVRGALDANLLEKRGEAFIKQQRTLSREEFDETLTCAAKQSEETAENILSGKIEPNPVIIGEHDSCKYCKFSAICGINDKKVDFKR